uniref:Uncharacterized protein n=1 Tax=Anguilla anguilla TaxID=7936 RepID=A0A0E9SZ51_ANGAN
MKQSERARERERIE